MRIRTIFASLLLVVASFSSVSAQSGTVVVSLDESFFEALLDAVFKDGNTVTFAENDVRDGKGLEVPDANGPSGSGTCDDSVKIQRAVGGRQTALKLRDGKIYMPVAFTGAYAPPLIGCLDYSGVADTEITLEFDSGRQSLVGRVQVTNVELNGTRGVGGSLIAKFVQRSIDEKINPIQILGLSSVSFAVPVQGANVSMKAVSMSHEIGGGAIIVRITYEFARS